MRAVNIILSGSDHRSVDAAMRTVMGVMTATDNPFKGPIPLLPQDEARVRRLIQVPAPNHKMMAELEFLVLPSTVNVDMKS